MDLEKELINEHKDLFNKYFCNKCELENFIISKLNSHNKTLRVMLNLINRLVNLSDKMDLICPGRRDLGVFFIVTCIESLYKHTQNIQIQKQEMVINFFEKHLSLNDKKVIKDGINVISVNGISLYKKINISEFALLLSAIRNTVAHEGKYWSFYFNDGDYNGGTINIIKSKLIKDEGYKDIGYEVRLTYSQFRDVCMRAFITFINACEDEGGNRGE